MENMYLDKNEFIKNFGYYSKLIRLDKVPFFVDYAMKLNDEYIDRKIRSDMSFYIHKCRRHNLSELIEVLFSNLEYRKMVIDNFDDWKNLLMPLNIFQIINILLRDKSLYGFIYENLATLLENAAGLEKEEEMIELLSQIDECKSFINNFKEKRANDKAYLHQLNLGTYMKLYKYNLLDEIKSYFTVLSNGNDDNIKYLSNGHTSVVYITCDEKKYIIKLGKERSIFKSQFFSLMLQPYLRKEFIFDGEVIATIEAQDFCITKDIKEEDYKKLREQIEEENLMWLDEDIRNVGYLTKPNTRKISKEEDGFDYENAPLTEPRGEEGDLVLIDSDMILSKEKAHIRHSAYNCVSKKYDYTIVLDCAYFDLDSSIKKLLNQTFNDYRVILLNTTLELASTYIKIDDRIHIDNCIPDDAIYYSDDFDSPYYLEEVSRSLKRRLEQP